MKKTKTCSKCGSIKIAGPLKTNSLSTLPETLRTATYETYTCMECGYSEFYPDEKGLENIRTFYKSKKA